LYYPQSILEKLQRKAREIREEKAEGKEKKKKIRILAPKSPMSEIVNKYLGDMVEITHNTGTKIGDIIKKRRKSDNEEAAGVYQIPCGGCNFFIHRRNISQYRHAD